MLKSRLKEKGPVRIQRGLIDTTVVVGKETNPRSAEKHSRSGIWKIKESTGTKYKQKPSSSMPEALASLSSNVMKHWRTQYPQTENIF